MHLFVTLQKMAKTLRLASCPKSHRKNSLAMNAVQHFRSSLLPIVSLSCFGRPSTLISLLRCCLEIILSYFLSYIYILLKKKISLFGMNLIWYYVSLFVTFSYFPHDSDPFHFWFQTSSLYKYSSHLFQITSTINLVFTVDSRIRQLHVVLFLLALVLSLINLFPLVISQHLRYLFIFLLVSDRLSHIFIFLLI